MMDQKDKEKLLELVICKGEIRSDTFQYSLDEKRDFAEKWGMKELFARHDQLENDIHWSEDTVAERRYEAELNEVRDLIVLQAKECLRKENIDIDKAFDMEQGDEERRKAILSQLSVLGIDENDAVRLGLDNAELLEEKGKSIRMSLPDTPERREVFDREGIEYEPGNGHLKITLTVEAKRGIALEDNSDSRRFLQENGIDYILLDREAQRNIVRAQNARYNEKERSFMFVPFTWSPANIKILNRKAIKLLCLIAGAGMATAVLSPVGAVVVTVAAKKTLDMARVLGYADLFRRNGKKKEEPTLTRAEAKALMAGEAIYREDKTGREMYIYMYNGNRYVMDAGDLVLPRQVDGVKLTILERERLRRGELVAVSDKDGEQIAFRVDPTSRDNIKRYYLNLKRDRQMTAVPGMFSDGKDKLEYIAQAGRKGIDDIFGTKARDKSRERFLSRYNLSSLYNHKSGDQADLQTMERLDRRIRDVAELEYNKARLRLRGMKI